MYSDSKDVWLNDWKQKAKRRIHTQVVDFIWKDLHKNTTYFCESTFFSDQLIQTEQVNRMFSDTWYFSLHDRGKNKGAWLKVGETFDDGKVEVIGYDEALVNLDNNS